MQPAYRTAVLPGADVLNLRRVSTLPTGMLSIGDAGPSDGIVLSGHWLHSFRRSFVVRNYQEFDGKFLEGIGIRCAWKPNEIVTHSSRLGPAG